MKLRCLFVVFAFVGLSQVAVSGIILTNSVASYSQDFDTLANTGTTGTVVPSGWQFSESGSSANTSYGIGTGSSATGNTYSFGLANATDRAFGTLRTGTLVPVIGASFQNGGTTTLTDLNITYFGEQWRVGTVNRLDQLDFQFSKDASSLTTGTWSDLNSLDFVRAGSSAVGATNGNLAANRQNLTATLSGINLAIGDSLWIRWTDFDAASFDDGLAIDDFQATATFALASVPEPGSGILVGVVGWLAFQIRRRSRRATAANAL